MKIIAKNLENILPELNPIDKEKYYLVTCPQCGKKEAYVYKNKDLIICNRINKCGYVSSIYDYLINDKKITDKEIVSLLYNEQKSEELFIDEDIKKIEIPDDVKMFKSNKSSFIKKKALRYLYKRNIPEKNINELGYIFNDEYGERIFIPFYENRELVYYTTRDITNSSLRWKDPKGFDKHKFVYNIDKMYDTNTVFIFEGLMCALSLEEQIGTAILTNTIGKEQVKKILSAYPKNIVLVPDIDIAGLSTIKRNINMFMDYSRYNINFYIFYVDNERRKKVEEIMRLDKSLEEKNLIIDKIRGYKDFNETKKNFIDIKQCVPYNNKNIFSKLKFHYSNT